MNWNLLSISLRNIDNVRFQDSLKYHGMEYCNLDGEIFETLLFEIGPKFPNLFCLDLRHNIIESIKPVVDRIKNDNYRIATKSLHFLNLYRNPILKKMKTDPIEKAAMLSFLESYNTVCYLGDKWLFRLDPDIECALRINHARLKIVVENGGNGSSGGSRSLPPSLWPTILERAYEKSDHIPGHTYGSWSNDKKKQECHGTLLSATGGTGIICR